jgi:hypothetical protein
VSELMKRDQHTECDDKSQKGNKHSLRQKKSSVRL